MLLKKSQLFSFLMLQIVAFRLGRTTIYFFNRVVCCVICLGRALAAALCKSALFLEKLSTQQVCNWAPKCVILAVTVQVFLFVCSYDVTNH